jgi:hypothetical protein
MAHYLFVPEFSPLCYEGATAPPHEAVSGVSPPLLKVALRCPQTLKAVEIDYLLDSTVVVTSFLDGLQERQMREKLYPWVVRSEGRSLVVRLTPVSAVAVLACLDRGDVVGQVLPLVPEVDELTHRVAVLRPVLRHLRMTEAEVRAMAQPPLRSSPPHVREL